MTANQIVSQGVLRRLAQNGMSQRTVADRLGVSEAAVSRKLHGRRPWRMDELDRVAQVLGVTVADLFTGRYHRWARNAARYCTVTRGVAA